MSNKSESNILEDSWMPPDRPEWVQKINAEGAIIDSAGVVPLDSESLINTAIHNTGLSNFGSDDWREPLTILLKSLNEEANLNLLGRIATRQDLLLILQARLQIEDAYQQHPEIEKEIIAAPLLITGAARTGTTALYNLLSADPDNRAPMLWETWFPSPSPEKPTYKTDPRIKKADDLAMFLERVAPGYHLLHEQRGYLPVEDNYLLILSLRGHCGWMGKTPSYIEWLVEADRKPSLDYMKRVLKYLQWKYGCKRWVLKSPGLTVPLTLIFEAFPDVMMVHTHRDPVKLTASSSNLLNSLFWIRSDDYQAYQDFYTILTDDETVASALNANIDLLENGIIPKGKIYNVLYQDFIEDNVAVVREIYDYFNIEYSQQSIKTMEHYATEDAQRRRQLPKYSYQNPSANEVYQLRQIFGKYQNHFNIPNEI